MNIAAALLHLPLGWILAQLILNRWPIRRLNFRKQEVPVATGIAQWFGLAGAVWWLPVVAGEQKWPVCCLILGMGLAGWLDDRYGDRSSGGFRGHLSAAVRGKVTTGFAKIWIGGASSCLAAWGIHSGVSLWLLVDATVIALAANTVNLFDLRPGRARAVCALQIATVAPWMQGPSKSWQWLLVGVAALLMDYRRDSRGEAMIGDTGANVLGAFVGFMAVATLPESGRIALLTTFAVLNIASERVSFSRVIEQTPWLRRVDRKLGARDML